MSSCSPYVPVPAKIKVKKNKVSQGAGALPSELSLALKSPPDDRESHLPALPASGSREPPGPPALAAGRGAPLQQWRDEPWRVSLSLDPGPALVTSADPRAAPDLLNQNFWVFTSPPRMLTLFENHCPHGVSISKPVLASGLSVSPRSPVGPGVGLAKTWAEGCWKCSVAWR